MVCQAARADGAETASVESKEDESMPMLRQSQKQEPSAPNAILESMRRRIARVGLLVAGVSIVLASLVIFFICACAHLR
jgi:hypothetical protein